MKAAKALLELAQRIKRALDPHNLTDPGSSTPGRIFQI